MPRGLDRDTESRKRPQIYSERVFNKRAEAMPWGRIMLLTEGTRTLG